MYACVCFAHGDRLALVQSRPVLRVPASRQLCALRNPQKRLLTMCVRERQGIWPRPVSGANEQPSLHGPSMMLWGSLSADTANAVVLSLLGGVGE